MQIIFRRQIIIFITGLLFTCTSFAASIPPNHSKKFGALCSMYQPDTSNILLQFFAPSGLLVATGLESPTTISAGYQATSQSWSSFNPAITGFAVNTYVIPTCQPMHGMLRLYFTSRNFKKEPSTAYVNITRTTEPCVLADGQTAYNKLLAHQLLISYDVSVNGSSARELSNAYSICTSDDNLSISLGKMVSGTLLPMTVFSSIRGLRVGGRLVFIPLNIAQPE